MNAMKTCPLLWGEGARRAGEGTRLSKNNISVASGAPHPALRATFSPRKKAKNRKFGIWSIMSLIFPENGDRYQSMLIDAIKKHYKTFG